MVKFIRSLELPFGAMQYSAKLPGDAKVVGMLFTGTSSRDFRLRMMYETESRLNEIDYEIFLVTDYSQIKSDSQYVGSFLQDSQIRHVYLRKDE